jgi:hypothetical protein
MRNPRPKFKVGDIIIGSPHPEKGYFMFQIQSAYRDDKRNFTWIYVGGGYEVAETFVDYVYRAKGFKKVKVVS